MKYAIELQNLCKSYGRQKVVDSLCIKVPEGKIYGFLGKNGAGKTTTIRMITGLIKPDGGEILIHGRNILEDRKWAAGNIGALVETPGFYENLTAEQNLGITAEMFGIPRKRIQEVLKLVGLEDTGSKRTKGFSLGMKQRLGIANCLMHSPGILILDEPANGLDPAGIRDMRRFLRALSVEQGIAVMISSHILSEIQQMADYIGIIDGGRLMEEADIQSITLSDQSYLYIETDDIPSSAGLLDAMSLNYTLEEEGIRVYCSREMNSRINRKLVDRGINVYGLTPAAKTLEERFLRITGEKSA